MILEREQWHLGYASLLSDCRGTEFGGGLTGTTTTSNNNTGRTLLLVHPDVDAMCTARILGYMLRADGVPHQLRVCTGWGRLCKILAGMGVIASPLNADDDDETGHLADKVVRHHVDDEDYDGNHGTTTTTCDVRAVVLVNMGANRNLAKLFNGFANANSQQSSSSGRRSNKVRCYVIDSHRPYHLANIHVGKDVVLFNDRPLDENDEIPSDGDDLSGNDDSSSSSSSSDDDDDVDEGDNGDGKRRSRKNAKWEDDYSDEEEFESDSIKDEENDEIVEENDVDDSDADDESMSMAAAAAKRAGLTTKRPRMMSPTNDDVDDDNDDPDAPLEELQDSEEEDNEVDDDEGSRWSKRRRSSQGLNTTTTTANLTTIMDETLLDDEQLVASSQTTSSSIQKVNYRALRKQRRTRVRLHYSSGSYHGSPSSWTAYTLCHQLRFGDIPDLLWLACVGLTDAYLHGKLDVAGYSALSINMKQHVGRLFPNDVIDRAGRAVYAEELETTYQEQGLYTSNNGGGGGVLTRIGLSENGRILYQDEYKFMLLRHTSLWDSMLHSNFVASKLRVWKSAGRQKLMELLAKMGFPLDQCRQPWAFVGPGMKRRLAERLDDCAEEYGLENVKYTGFIRVTGYKSRLSASDMSYAVTALLECSAAAMDGGASVSNSSNMDDNTDDPLAGLNEEDREDREMIEAFNVAFDALNSNGGGPVSSSSESMLNEVGGGEGADLSNLVNGGNMTGMTGLGAGIRLAMTLQRTIMSTARGLVDRNAITRLSHFRYAYLHCTSGGGVGASLSNSSSNGRVVTPDPSGDKNGETSTTTTNNRSNQFHVFAKPLVLTRLAHFLMDMHREDGKWTGTKSRPLVLLAEKPRSNTYMVVGYECPEEAGNVVKNKFGQNFDLAAKSMRGMFWFDSFDSNVVEVAARDVQKFLEQLHYMMEV